MHTPDRAICTCKVREEREEAVGRQDWDIYSCKGLDWARRSNSRAAPNAKEGSAYPLLAGWTTFKGFLTPACLGDIKKNQHSNTTLYLIQEGKEEYLKKLKKSK